MEAQSFYDYLDKKFPIKTSGTISSYKKALQILDTLFRDQDIFHLDGMPLRDIKDPALIARIVDYVVDEENKFKKGEKSFFSSGLPIPPSYANGGFCSAAIRKLRDYINEISQYESVALMSKYRNRGAKLSKELMDKFKLNGEDTEKEAVVKRRIGQDIFRAMLIKIYDGKCCLTGLDVPEVLRASHILPWSKDEKNRLNPENGLCLSATYDAAFDKHLISFDEDYRLVLSKALKDEYSSEAFKTYFLDFEGKAIQMPSMFRPSVKFLEKHREQLVG